MLIKDVEQFAESCCQQDTKDPYLCAHVQLVREFAVRLAHIEHADGEVCEIAALLHDIEKYKGRRNHHITGKEVAEQFLKTQPLPEEKKDLILKCILKHRSTISSEDNEIEVRICNLLIAWGHFSMKSGRNTAGKQCQEKSSRSTILKVASRSSLLNLPEQLPCLSWKI